MQLFALVNEVCVLFPCVYCDRCKLAVKKMGIASNESCFNIEALAYIRAG